jgi:hypothetical protein
MKYREFYQYMEDKNDKECYNRVRPVMQPPKGFYYKIIYEEFKKTQIICKVEKGLKKYLKG